MVPCIPMSAWHIFQHLGHECGENYESEAPPSSVHQDGQWGGHGAPRYDQPPSMVSISVDSTFCENFRCPWQDEWLTIPDLMFLCSGCLVQKKQRLFLTNSSFFWLVIWAMSTLTQKSQGTVLLGVRAFEWMFSLSSKDSEGTAFMCFFSENFSTKLGEKSSNHGLYIDPVDRFWSKVLLPIPFSLGSMFRWNPSAYGCPIPMDKDHSVPWKECFRMTRVIL